MAGTVTAAAVALAAVLAWASAGGRSSPSAQRAPSPSTTAAPTTVAPTTTTAPAADPVHPVSETDLTVTARDRTGSPVQVPTSVWRPSDGAGRRFPLVVFSPGYQISPSEYDPLVRAWAAAGYVVAEPTYPDTAPGSPEVEYDIVNHPAELAQVIDAILAPGTALAATVDPSEVAVAGQSDGGDVSLAAAADSCCRDHRIKAAVILSGAEASLFGGSYYRSGNPPLLVVQGDRDTLNLPGCSQQLYDGAGPPRYYLDLPDATHLSAYTAAGAQLDAVKTATVDFFDGYLKHLTSGLSRLGTDSVPGLSRLTSTAPIPVTGGCPGAPGGG